LKVLRSQNAFTLLEVLIAFGLLSVLLLVAVITQSSSLVSSGRSNNILIATNLARNLMNEKEVKYEGVALDQLPKQEQGEFPAPNANYKWTLTFEEVDFSVLSDVLLKQAEANNEQKEANSDTLVKMFEDYMKKSVRRMTLTVEYPDSGGNSKLAFTQLLVNYDADFATGI
jgi:type II secretory pathway pseudopilin PulG